jgi:hypothetical protein
MQSPGKYSSVITSSTREMIDLTFEEESEPIMKTGQPISPAQSRGGADMPQTVTLRKRPKNHDMQDETPSRPPLKKQKSPTGAALPLAFGPTIGDPSLEPVKGHLLSSIMPPFTSQDNSLTQIPDSGGEDNDAFYGEDFHSDDIPEDTKEILGTPHKASNILPPLSKGFDRNIVPESPRRASGDCGAEIGENERSGFSVRRHPQSLRNFTDELHDETTPMAPMTGDLAQTKPFGAFAMV